jgi:hypothetical protein
MSGPIPPADRFLDQLSSRLDAFGRRHFGLMMSLTLLAAVVATVLLLSQTEGPVVLYQAY